jgi:hypothetical protein
MKRRLIARRGVTVTQRHYTDAALLWGQAHPQQAEMCLQPPPFPPPTATTATVSEKPNNWTDFWNWRNWMFSSSRRYEEALVSHVLTGPLTLASADHTVSQWTCLGARAESMLPVPYWNEFLYYKHPFLESTDDDNNNATHRHTTLSFVGPECENVPSQHTLSVENNTLSLKWSFRGKYHDMPQEAAPTSGFVLFNPGFAHPHLQKDWRPTLERLWDTTGRSSRVVVVLTAHSLADAERDWQLWHSVDSTLPNYQENPWASQITYQDPLDRTNTSIRPNLYVCHHVMT